MEALLSQGCSYSVLPFVICGYPCDSRRFCQEFGRNRPHGDPAEIQRTSFSANLRDGSGQESRPHLSGSRIEAPVDIDRLPGDVAIACEHHGNIGNLLRTPEPTDGYAIGCDAQIGSHHVRLD